MTVLGIRRPGDGWFFTLRERFYRVWLATLAFCIVVGGTYGECIPLYGGLLLYLGLCPLGLALVVVHSSRAFLSEQWVYDPELGQILRVAERPFRRLLKVAELAELTGVALAAEEVATIRVAPDGLDPTAEQVVYLLRGSAAPVGVARFDFLERAEALSLAEELAEQLDLPLRIGGPHEWLSIDAGGELTFVPYDYDLVWLRGPMGAAIFFSWPLGLIGTMLLSGLLVAGFR
ncbi:MAG: hypothetical protein AB7S38_33160 [Vulcanimicrobiota bacterium]